MAVVIFFIARGVLGLTTPFFAQVERGELSLPWLDRYTVRATRGLVNIGVWLFALAMAYPYLPGSETEAFKGISVLLGVMLSLGSSNFVGQAVSGLILTYSHTLHSANTCASATSRARSPRWAPSRSASAPASARS